MLIQARLVRRKLGACSTCLPLSRGGGQNPASLQERSASWLAPVKPVTQTVRHGVFLLLLENSEWVCEVRQLPGHMIWAFVRCLLVQSSEQFTPMEGRERNKPIRQLKGNLILDYFC